MRKAFCFILFLLVSGVRPVSIRSEIHGVARGSTYHVRAVGCNGEVIRSDVYMPSKAVFYIYQFI